MGTLELLTRANGPLRSFTLLLEEINNFLLSESTAWDVLQDERCWHALHDTYSTSVPVPNNLAPWILDATTREAAWIVADLRVRPPAERIPAGCAVEHDFGDGVLLLRRRTP